MTELEKSDLLTAELDLWWKRGETLREAGRVVEASNPKLRDFLWAMADCYEQCAEEAQRALGS